MAVACLGRTCVATFVLAASGLVATPAVAADLVLKCQGLGYVVLDNGATMRFARHVDYAIEVFWGRGMAKQYERRDGRYQFVQAVPVQQDDESIYINRSRIDKSTGQLNSPFLNPDISHVVCQPIRGEFDRVPSNDDLDSAARSQGSFDLPPDRTDLPSRGFRPPANGRAGRDRGTTSGNASGDDLE